MRDEIVNALVAARAVTSSEAEQARILLHDTSAPALSLLIEAGFDADDVMRAASQASGIPLLPDKWLRTPKPPARLPVGLHVLAGLDAAPVGTLKGELCVAYADPEVAKSPAARALPSHRAFLATGDDVRRILRLAGHSPEERDVEPEEPPRLPSGAIEALPLPSAEADTLFEPRPDFEHMAATDGDGGDAPTVRVDAVYDTPADPNATIAIAQPTPLKASARVAPAPAAQAVRVSSTQSAVEAARERALLALPRFRVRGVLGRGGMATVYLADDTSRGEKVALKLMEPHLAEDATFVERFRREVRATASFDHPNVVRLYDGGVEGETLYMASEYVDGGTVRDLLVNTGPMPIALVVNLLYQTLRGLAHAHDLGIVHRDLKPANLLLTTTGLLKVGDFGVAKSQTDNTLTQSGMLFGTPAYMSPEQAFGKTLDARSDLFSLSTLAYELLTGRNPYHHENMSTSLLMVSKVSARPIFEVCPTLPPLLEEVLSRMMERERGQRYRDAHAAADKLEPLVTAIAAQHGNVLADAVDAPRAAARRLNKAQAEAEHRLAQRLLAESEPRVREAAFRLFKARTLDPDNPAPQPFLEQLTREHGFEFHLEADPKVAEIEEALTKKPDSPALLRRGADLMLARKNLLGAAAWIRRYARMTPGDIHMEHTLEGILGTDALAPFAAAAPPPAASLEPLELAREPNAAPALVLPSFENLVPPGAASRPPDDTAFVRSVAKPKLIRRLKKRAGLLVGAAAVLVVALVLVVLAVGGDEEPRGAGLRKTAGDDVLARLSGTPEEQAARMQRQQRMIDLSQSLAAKGQLADATAALDQAIAEDPGSEVAVDALLARARLYVNLRRLEDARTDLQKVQLLVQDDDPRAAAARELLSGL